MSSIFTRQTLSFLGLCAFLFLAVGSTDTGRNNQGKSPASVKEESKYKNNLVVVDSRIESDEYTRYIVGIVKNYSNIQYSYVQVEINLYDESGAQVGSTMANVNNLEPYGTWKFKAIILEDNAKKYQIKGVTGY